MGPLPTLPTQGFKELTHGQTQRKTFNADDRDPADIKHSWHFE